MPGNATMPAPAEEIETKIASLADWRGATLARVRSLIRAADSDVVEEVKWRKPTNPAGVPCWSRHGLICTGETYRDKVKLTFSKGAALDDPTRIFNASLDAGTRRAVDLREGDMLDEAAFTTLIQAAVAANASG
jgi:hypothetical protein